MKSIHFFILVLLLPWVATCSSAYKPPGEYSGPHKYMGPRYKSPRFQAGNFKVPKKNTNSPRFIWPINKAKLTQKFSPSYNPAHAGIDLANVRGTPILASHNGVVVLSGQRYSGYGKMIILELDEHWGSLYAHLDKLFVKQGDQVRQGDVIGAMGRTGRATGVHLHFELIYKKIPVDPLASLKKNN